MLNHRRSFNYPVQRALVVPLMGVKRIHVDIKPETMDMFKGCSSYKISVDYLFGTGHGTVNMIAPQFLHCFLGKRIGWHLMIETVK